MACGRCANADRVNLLDKGPMLTFLTVALSLTTTLPGTPLSAVQLDATIKLSSDEARRLVLIRGAQISGLEQFQSKAGLTHLRFRVLAGGASYSAIAYQNDWTPATRRALESGHVDAVGVWNTFQGAPSFTLKSAVLAKAQAAVPTNTVSSTNAPRDLLRIRGAVITPGSVQKFTAKSQAQHVSYTFVAEGKTYQGVLYAGTWNSAALDQLRSGRATLYGRWGTFEGRPNFVTTRVTP